MPEPIDYEKLRLIRDREIMRVRLYEKLEAVEKFKKRFKPHVYEEKRNAAKKEIDDFNSKYPLLE